MSLPPKNSSYSDVDYWNERYSQETSYDWFKPYVAFRHLLIQYVRPEDRILMLGCGNSPLSEEMYLDCFHHITNIDYSAIAIENMRSKAPHMHWEVMDARQLVFQSGSFDVVLDKGTLDALLTSEKSPWDLSEAAQENMKRVLAEVSRVLRPDGGRFISITFAQPHFRRLLFQREEYGWDFNFESFGDGFHYYFYVLTRGRTAPKICLEPRKALQRDHVVLQDDDDMENFLQRMVVEDL